MFTICSASHHGCYPHHHHSPIHIHHPATPPKEDLGHVEVHTSKQEFLVQLDTRGYSPEELEVSTLNGFLVIQGETGESGGEEFKSWRKFCRRFLLPLHCKEAELRGELDAIQDGESQILKVTIPREVPNQRGKLHLVKVSDKGLRHPAHHHHGHGYDAAHMAMNGRWISGVECNKDFFVLRLDLARFSEDEILVKTVDDYLVVEGNQGEKEEENGVFASFSFSRSYHLPLNGKREEISCELGGEADGRLTVMVPRMGCGKSDDHHHEKRIHKVERKISK